jgi:hypothetical protein
MVKTMMRKKATEKRSNILPIEVIYHFFYPFYYKLIFIHKDGKIRPKRNARKREGFYGDNGRVGNDNDPFTLIPVGYYTQAKDAPFKVEIGSDVLVSEFKTCSYCILTIFFL